MLGDLVQTNTVILAVCGRCKHEKMLFPADIIVRLGAEQRIAALVDKLRCGRCMVIVHEARGDLASIKAGPPSEERPVEAASNDSRRDQSEKQH